MSYYPSTQHTQQHPPPCFADSVLPYKMKGCLSRAAWACQLTALILSPSPSSRPASSLPLSPPSLPRCFGCGPVNPSLRQPPDRELTWTLDTVPARLTRLFAQSRVDNSSSSSSGGGTITGAGADHVWKRGGFNAVTTDVGGGEQGTATLVFAFHSVTTTCAKGNSHVESGHCFDTLEK